MSGFKVTRFDEADLVSYGPASNVRTLVGDDEGSTSIRLAMQFCNPGYKVPAHCHPYAEYLLMIEGEAELFVEGEPMQSLILRKGDVIQLDAGVWHGFTVLGNQNAQLLGVHVSPKRIVNFKPGVATDARGYRV